MKQSKDELLDQIGRPGENINDSMATSAMNVPSDMARVVKYDHYWFKWQKNRSKQNGWLFSIGVLCVNLWTKGYGLVGGIGLALIVLWLLIRPSHDRILNEMCSYYEMGLLTPGMIVNVSTEIIEVLVLAPLGQGTLPDIYGCKKIQIKPLPDTTLAIGEKIPCVSVFYASNSDDYYIDFVPRPVSWGYKDPEISEKAIEAIEADPDHEKSNCWEILKELEEKMTKVEVNDICRFDTQLQNYD